MEQEKRGAAAAILRRNARVFSPALEAREAPNCARSPPVQGRRTDDRRSERYDATGDITGRRPKANRRGVRGGGNQEAERFFAAEGAKIKQVPHPYSPLSAASLFTFLESADISLLRQGTRASRIREDSNDVGGT